MTNLPELIDLCDPKTPAGKWIQERWKPRGGDQVYCLTHKRWDVLIREYYSGEWQLLQTAWSGSAYEISNFIWLPISINPDTGKLQIVELIEEAQEERLGEVIQEVEAGINRNTLRGCGDLVETLLKIKELIS